MASATSRRKQRSGGANNEDASKLIRENMKCPVCLEVLLPPIYQCETGHNICYLCVDEVTECPLCKSDYGDTRNYFAEELVNSMTFPCKYEEYGCHKTFLGSQLKEHQENCECQPYRCPELACQEVVGIHQMSRHLDKHGFKVMKGDAHQASVEILDDHFDRKTEYNPWRISAFDLEFYAVSTRCRDGLWYFWAYGLGLPKDIKKFSYEIVLYSEEKQVMYRGAVQSLRTAPEDIMKSGSCLITNDNVIKSIRCNGRIKCQVYFIQGKNWENRGAGKAKQALKNLKKKMSQKGKHKVLIPSTATFTCSLPTSAQTALSSQLSTPKNSRSRVLHNNVKASAIELMKKENGGGSNVSTSASGGASNVNVVSKLLKNLKPKRSLSRPPAVTITEEENKFVQKIRDTLRCPGCNEVISPPVFQCLIGHNVCHKCKVSRQDCALCRAPLGDCRNFFAEELLYKTFQRCTFSKHGCAVCLPSAQMRSHEAVCEFAPFECPFNVCRTLVSAEDLFEHLQTHQISVVDKELKNEVIVPRNSPSVPVCTIPNILTVETLPFYPIVLRDTDGSWMFYVISQHHSKYRSELLIKKQSKTIAFQGAVLSLRTNFAQVKQKGLGLVAAEKTIKCFKSHEKLTYQVKVIKKTDHGSSAKSSPSSWVLMPKSGEVVSKTELFANKKTSISPNEDSDEEEDVASTLRHDATAYTSETEDFETESEMMSETSTSHSTAKEDDSENEWEVPPKKAEASECKLCQTETRSGETTLDEMSETDNKEACAKQELAPVPVESVSVEKKHEDKPQLDINNNEIFSSSNNEAYETSSISSGSSGSAKKEEKAQAPVEFKVNQETSTSNKTILEFQGTGPSTVVPSLEKLKMPKEVTPISEQSSAMIADPKAASGPILKKAANRSRSALRNRVRMSEDIISTGWPDSTSVVTKCKAPSKSQANLHSSPSRLTALSTMPSKHVLSTHVQDAEEKEEKLPEQKMNAPSEFDELKQAIETYRRENGDEAHMPVMEDDDLLAITSLNGMSEAFSAVNDAVISGGFDVVKSVISLFTSDKTETTADNSNENLES